MPNSTRVKDLLPNSSTFEFSEKLTSRSRTVVDAEKSIITTNKSKKGKSDEADRTRR
ncbi:MAG: hypothetical protein HOQ05_11700 [Corynebacteriales bacterium]|nr:hypothetical protein [Mycobacteriales bacterium]